MELINAKIVEGAREKFIVAEKPKWGINIDGRRVFFKATARYKGGIVKFESSKVDFATAKKIAEEIDKTLNCKVSSIKYFTKKAVVCIYMEEKDGNFIL